MDAGGVIMKQNEIPINENNNQNFQPRLFVEEIKIRCPYCGNRHAFRQHKITNIRDAVYICTYCGKRVK